MTETSNENQYYGNVFVNIPECIHCYNNVCSSAQIISTSMRPIYIEDTTSRNLDINIIARKLPLEILVKIYNDYIRPHKFAQLFNIITANTIYCDYPLHVTNKIEFIKHFRIFLYKPIKKYLMKIDTEFNTVATRLTSSNYASEFRLITNIKSSVYLEILMRKYH